MVQVVLPNQRSKIQQEKMKPSEVISRSLILKLIEAGIQAPSADNMQPWKFKIITNGLEIWDNETNKEHFFDHNRIATNYSFGAVIENIISYSKYLKLKSTIIFTKDNSNKIAVILFEKRSSHFEKGINKEIFDRCTNRNLYQFKKEISTTIVDNLKAIIQNINAFQLHDYNDKKLKQEITSIVTAVDSIRFNHQKIQQDFYNVLRFGKTASKLKDGLAEKTLGLESILIPPLKILKSWPLTKFLNYFGFYFLMALRSTWLPMKSSSNIMAITHSGPVNYFEFGRIMQKFWLTATKEGLSVQPLGVMPLLLSRIDLSNGNGLNQKQIQLLTILKNRFLQITPHFNNDTDQIVMLFRIGYSKKIPHKSFRKPVESFLIES